MVPQYLMALKASLVSMSTEELHDVSTKLDDLIHILVGKQITVEDVLIERLAENLVEIAKQQ
jgi:hypothetical protein